MPVRVDKKCWRCERTYKDWYHASPYIKVRRKSAVYRIDFPNTCKSCIYKIRRLWNEGKTSKGLDDRRTNNARKRN